MASRAYKERVLQALDGLPDEKAAEVLKLAQSLREPPPQATPQAPRRLGTFRGRIHMESSFFDPLPNDLLDAFEGKGQ